MYDILIYIMQYNTENLIYKSLDARKEMLVSRYLNSAPSENLMDRLHRTTNADACMQLILGFS